MRWNRSGHLSSPSVVSADSQPADVHPRLTHVAALSLADCERWLTASWHCTRSALLRRRFSQRLCIAAHNQPAFQPSQHRFGIAFPNGCERPLTISRQVPRHIDNCHALISWTGSSGSQPADRCIDTRIHPAAPLLVVSGHSQPTQQLRNRRSLAMSIPLTASSDSQPTTAIHNRHHHSRQLSSRL